MSHDDLTHTTGTRDKKVFAVCLLGDFEPPTGSYGVSADSLGLPDAEYDIGRDLPPSPLAPGTKRGRP